MMNAAVAEAESICPLNEEEMARYLALFEPKSIAVVGASQAHNKWGYMIPMNIVKGGFTGKVYGVNPKLEEVLGFKVFPSVSDLPETVDLGMIIVPPGAVAGALREFAECGTKTVVIITAGFGELDDDKSRAAQQEIKAIGAEYDMVVVGPNCAGIMSPEPQHLYAAMFGRETLPSGGLSIVSQSGNVAGTVMAWAKMHQVGLGRIVSSGNEAVTETEDFLRFYADDERTKVIVTYIEGVPNGRRLFEALRYASERKPVVALKGGRSPAGSRATESHTGSLAAPMNLFRAACRQAGAILVDDIFELTEVASALLNQPLPMGRRVAIVSQGGGWGVMAADACAEAGLELATLPEETIAELDSFLPGWWSRGNPIDLVAGTTDPGAQIRAGEIAVKCPDVDVLLFLGIGHGSQGARMMDAFDPPLSEGKQQVLAYMRDNDVSNVKRLVELQSECGKPIFPASEAVLDAYGPSPNAGIEVLESHGIIASHSLHTVARVIAHLAERREFLEGIPRKPARLTRTV